MDTRAVILYVHENSDTFQLFFSSEMEQKRYELEVEFTFFLSVSNHHLYNMDYGYSAVFTLFTCGMQIMDSCIPPVYFE